MTWESYCPRERRRVARVRVDRPHLEAVMKARPAFLAARGGRLPRWSHPGGMSTVDLHPRYRAERDWPAVVEEERQAIMAFYGVPEEMLTRLIKCRSSAWCASNRGATIARRCRWRRRYAPSGPRGAPSG